MKKCILLVAVLFLTGCKYEIIIDGKKIICDKLPSTWNGYNAYDCDDGFNYTDVKTWRKLSKKD
jgi:hypothetical protein